MFKEIKQRNVLWDVWPNSILCYIESLQSYISIRELGLTEYWKLSCEVYWEVSDERVLDAFVTDGARVMAAESMSVLKTIGDVYFQLRVKLLTSSTPKHFLKSPLSWRYLLFLYTCSGHVTAGWEVLLLCWSFACRKVCLKSYYVSFRCYCCYS